MIRYNMKSVSTVYNINVDLFKINNNDNLKSE